MVSLIIGHKGSGKTKLLVDRVNAAVESQTAMLSVSKKRLNLHTM